MQVSQFQALCLLADADSFMVYPLHGKARRLLNLVETEQLISSEPVITLTGRQGRGYLLRVGNLYVKADGKRCAKYYKSNGRKLQWKKSVKHI